MKTLRGPCGFPRQFLAAMVICAALTPDINARAEVRSASGTVLSPDSQSLAADRISLAAHAATTSSRDVTLDDIVSIREIHEPRLSPDGQTIAFLVRQAFRGCDCYRVALYIVPRSGSEAPRKLFENASIFSIRWRPDGRAITFLSSTNNIVELLELSMADNRKHKLFDLNISSGRLRAAAPPSALSNTPGVTSYEWSHDGTSIAVATSTPMAQADLATAMKRGIPFDDRFGIYNLLDGPEPRPSSNALWIVHPRSNRNDLAWQTPVTYASWAPGSLVWSWDDTHVAFNFDQPSKDAKRDVWHIGLVDVKKNNFVDLLESEGADNYLFRVAWARDNTRLAFVSWHPMDLESVVQVVDISSSSLVRQSISDAGLLSVTDSFMEWSPRGSNLIALMNGRDHRQEKTGLFRVEPGGAIRRITSAGQKVSECDAIRDNHSVCVVQSPTVPPAIASIDLDSGSIVAVPKTQVNPELGQLRLAGVRELRWNNRFGQEASGYLLLPRASHPGKRYPLVVMNYFFSGEFVADASRDDTAYPAQVLARDGYAVLLINRPRYDKWKGDDFARGSLAYGYGPLSSLERVVAKLSGEGIVDRSRVGFAGFSWGGFWVEFALTHSKLIAAAEMLNGGTCTEPGTYWISGEQYSREEEDRVMGGPPWGTTLKNYVSFSPTLNGDKVSAPLLIQASNEDAQYELQMYTALRRNSRPVDMMVYLGDGHSLESPEHRFQSMDLNLDWFEFWLNGREDPDVEKAEQYRRWEKLCDMQKAGNPDKPTFCIGSKH
jgi:dipeptidyl aminopeptidase/acylaminoacyl peptidase